MKIMKRGKAPEEKPVDSQKSAAEQKPAGKKDAKPQPADSRIDALVKANEQMAKELKDIRQRFETFKSLEEVQRMARDTAKDLLAMKALQSKVGSDSDKVGKMFTDTQKKYAEMQNLKGMMAKLTDSVTASGKDVSGMKAKLSNLPDKSQMEEIKKALKDRADMITKGQIIDPKAVRDFFNKSISLEKDVETLKARAAGLPDKSQMDEIKKALQSKVDQSSKIQGIDPKAIKDFINRSSDIEKDIGTLKVRFDKMLNVVDMFTERLNQAQKDVQALKQAKPGKGGPAASPELMSRIASAEKAVKDFQALEERMDEMEAVMEKLSDKMKSSGKSAPSPIDTSMRDRVAKLEDSITDIEDKLSSAGGHDDIPASAAPSATPKQVSDLRERIDDLEQALEKVTEKLKSQPAVQTDSPVPVPSELKDIRTLMDRIGRMESSIKDLRERLASVDEEMSKASGQAQEADIKPAAERLNSMDSRITAVSDRLMRLGGDCQKLSDYFMEGMKHMEGKMNGIEKLVAAEDKAISSIQSSPQPFTPSTYRSHLKRQAPQPLPGLAEEEEPAARPITDDMGADDDFIDDDDDLRPPMRPTPPMGPGMTTLPADLPGLEGPGTMPFPNRAPGMLPPPPLPQRSPSNMFTKLREGTVIKKELPQPEADSDDIEIVMEHIVESLRRRESRDKITRDLMGAGFGQKLIDKAFMQLRSGN